MKQHISVLTLVLLTFALHAESVWTGNAAVQFRRRRGPESTRAD